MSTFRVGKLQIITTKIGPSITMIWIGQSDTKEPSSELTPHLKTFVDEARGREATIKFNQLEFMNSSSVRVILEFISNLNAAGVPTIVTYDDKTTWQKSAFIPFEIFCRKLHNVTVRVE